MSDYIKIILPDGTERYVRKITFDTGFQMSEDKFGLTIANLNYQGGIDYEHAKNIYDLSQYEWKSVAPNNKWNNAIVYAVQNNTADQTITFKLPINTTIPISKGLMNSSLSDVIVVDENGNILPWYYNDTNSFGEFDIVVTADVPSNGGIKNFFVLFGNSSCVGVFRKPAGASAVRLPFELSAANKYSIYPLSSQTTNLIWDSDGVNGYVDVSSLADGEVFIIELDDTNGLAKGSFDYSTAVDVEKLQWLQPEPTVLTEPDVKVVLVRNKFLPTWPYYWKFDVTNDDTVNTLEGQVCIEFDSTSLVMNGYLKPDGRDLRLAVIDAYGNPIQMLDYYLEEDTVGTTQTRVWTKLYIAPAGTVHLALMFGNPYAYNESNGNVIFDFFEEFRIKVIEPFISVSDIGTSTKKVTIQNPYTDRSFVSLPVKLPVKAPNVLAGYMIAYGYADFDNNNNGQWTKYINIPITTPPSDYIQYKIEIVGDTINVYSNDGTTILVSGSGALDFWNNVQQDGSDIRVFDQNITQNYFWLEEWDYTNQKCIMWTKINAGQEQLNIAYGNTDCLASNYNNGDLTFEFFDDFDDGTYTDKWTVLGGTWSERNGIISQTNTTSSHYALQSTASTINDNVIFESKCRTTYNNRTSIGVGSNATISSGLENVYLVNLHGYGDLLQVAAWDGTTEYISGISVTVDNNVFYILCGILSGSTLTAFLFDLNYNVLTTTSITQSIANIGNKVELQCHQTADYDWIRVRKYISADLNFGTPVIKQF